MRLKKSIAIFAISFLPLFACHEKSAKSDRVILIQPFADFNSSLAENTCRQIKLINAATILRTPMGLPKEAYYLFVAPFFVKNKSSK